jgi:diketogulonate reductase-like aldo/keto reductase
VTNRDDGPLRACEEYAIGFTPRLPWAAAVSPRWQRAEVAAAPDATPQQVALAWSLEHSDVTLPVQGTSSHDHLAEIVASGVDLADEDPGRLV